MSKNYYYIVSSLKEYSLDSETKGLSVKDVCVELIDGLSEKDKKYLEMMLGYYDIINIINKKLSKGTFSDIGNYSKEDIEAICDKYFGKQQQNSIEIEKYIPFYINKILMAYSDGMYAQECDINTGMSIENALIGSYFNEMIKSSNKFLREWYSFDMDVRNIASAYTAREKGIDIESVLIDDNEVTELLKTSSLSDFGLKGTFTECDELMQILETEDMLKKERMLDVMRWNKIDDIVIMDYFNINRILSYITKLSIINRWMVLDKETGTKMFNKLIAELTNASLLDKDLEAV